MYNKADLTLNQLATNLGIKIGQLEGEKAVLQVELNLTQQENQELKRKIEEMKEDDSNVESE